VKEEEYAFRNWKRKQPAPSTLRFTLASKSPTPKSEISASIGLIRRRRRPSGFPAMGCGESRTGPPLRWYVSGGIVSPMETGRGRQRGWCSGGPTSKTVAGADTDAASLMGNVRKKQCLGNSFLSINEVKVVDSNDELLSVCSSESYLHQLYSLY
jgi:hypothetical protein